MKKKHAYIIFYIVFFILIVFLQMISVIKQKELFPFSPIAMYSRGTYFQLNIQIHTLNKSQDNIFNYLGLGERYDVIEILESAVTIKDRVEIDYSQVQTALMKISNSFKYFVPKNKLLPYYNVKIELIGWRKPFLLKNLHSPQYKQQLFDGLVKAEI